VILGKFNAQNAALDESENPNQPWRILGLNKVCWDSKGSQATHAI